MTQYDELLKLAKAATALRDRYDGESIWDEFRSAANPQVVIKLIEDLKVAIKELEDNCECSHPLDMCCFCETLSRINKDTK